MRDGKLNRGGGRRGVTWIHVLLVALATSGAIAAWLALHRPGPDAASDERKTTGENADLIAIKSEAERLAVEGRLAEAHAKYRQLQETAARRDVRDASVADALRRARADQD